MEGLIKTENAINDLSLFNVLFEAESQPEKTDDTALKKVAMSRKIITTVVKECAKSLRDANFTETSNLISISLANLNKRIGSIKDEDNVLFLLAIGAINSIYQVILSTEASVEDKGEDDFINLSKQDIKDIVNNSFKPIPTFWKNFLKKSGMQAMLDSFEKIKNRSEQTESVESSNKENLNEVLGILAAGAAAFAMFKKRKEIFNFLKSITTTGNVTSTNSVAAYSELFGGKGIHKALYADLDNNLKVGQIKKLSSDFEVSLKKIGILAPSIKPVDATPENEEIDAEKKTKISDMTKSEKSSSKSSWLFKDINSHFAKGEANDEREKASKTFQNISRIKKGQKLQLWAHTNEEQKVAILNSILKLIKRDVKARNFIKNNMRNEDLDQMIKDGENYLKISQELFAKDKPLAGQRSNFINFLLDYAKDNFHDLIGHSESSNESKNTQNDLIMERWQSLAGIK